MLKKLQNMLSSKKKKETAPLDVEVSRKTVSYWRNCIQRAGKKMPTNEWEIARLRLSAYQDRESSKAEDTRPVVNDFRNHYEGSRAYLDQRAPSFKIKAAPAFINDQNILKRAECEKLYLERIWEEQECQKAETQKLNSALVRNVGFTMPVFDVKKWMPSVRYLPATDVRLDPDCGGLWERMSWCAYKENISLEELKAINPDITEADVEVMQQKKMGSVLTEDELTDVDESEKDLYSVITIWHIFARNDAAIRMYEKEDEKELLPKSIAQELNLDTPRRYLQIADGLDRPLRDINSWPFDLDHNEMPITPLQMNHEPENLYGFTDYQQMERMDELSDHVMNYIELDAYFSAIRKYLAGKSSEMPSEQSIEDFINSNKRSVLLDFLDEAGNPLLKEISVGQTNTALPGHYELMHDQAKEASGQNELMSESIADFKDVTAIGVRYQEQKLHQRVNLRLGGPRGYEKSIQEDAVKLLEIAHQFVPKMSSVASIKTVQVYDEITKEEFEEQKEVIESLPWEDAKKALLAGGRLLELGIDAIVGPELAQYWVTTDDTPIEDIRLSTEILVMPGSTRTITRQQHAAELEAYYSNILWPTLYEPMKRLDLAKRFNEYIGKLKGIDRMEDFLPQDDEINEFLKRLQQAEQEERQLSRQGEADQSADEMRKQAAADAELQRAGVKAELEMEKEMQKAEFEQAKGEMQLELARQKTTSQQPAGRNE